MRWVQSRRLAAHESGGRAGGRVGEPRPLVRGPRRSAVAEVVAAVVSYAMAHGGIAFLHRIVVTVPPTVGDVDDLFVHAEVVDAQGDV